MQKTRPPHVLQTRLPQILFGLIICRLLPSSHYAPHLCLSHLVPYPYRHHAQKKLLPPLLQRLLRWGRAYHNCKPLNVSYGLSKHSLLLTDVIAILQYQVLDQL